MSTGWVSVGLAVLSLAVSTASGSAGAAAGRRCGPFSVHAYRVSGLRVHLASCHEARAMIRAWAGRRFRDGGPPVYGPWSCFFLPPRHLPQCSAGLNGLVEFTLTRRH